MNKTVLIICDFFPCPGTDGRSAYLLDIIDYLALNSFAVKLCVLSDTPNGTVPWYLAPAKLADKAEISIIGNQRLGKRFFIRFNLRNWVLALPCIIYRRLPSLLHNFMGKFVTRQRGEVSHFMVKSGSAAFVNDLLENGHPDTLIFNHSRLAALKEQLELPEKALTGVIAHDVMHRRHQSFAASGIDVDSREVMSMAEEKAALAKFDFIIAIQEDDAGVFKEMLPESTVITAPMSTSFPADAVHPAKRIVPGRCLIVGGYGQPNIDSFNWFLRDVWPGVYSGNPAACLHVCGNVCRALQTPDGMNISLLGRIEDLSREYEEAELCVIPLLAGSGLKIKLIEALKYNCRCVSTSWGVQGIRTPEKYGITVADTAGAMADAILSATRSHSGNDGQRFFEDFSPDNCYGELVELMQRRM